MKNQSEDTNSKSKSWWIYGSILLAIFGAALALRILPMHSAVFGSGFINIQGVDSIYHLRIVENLLHHFPFRISFDPYTFFPYGQDVYFAPLYDWLAGFCAWVIGLGSPDQHTIETVVAYFPAVLGALVTIPVFFIGKTLFNRNAGLIAAIIVGILPGTFLFRSRLGFFDHHVAEILFSTLTILFLVLALKQVKEHPISFNDFRNKNWKLLTKPLLFAGLAGVTLGAYLLAWVGGLLFVFLIFGWIVLMFVIEHLKKQSTDYICILGVPVFLLGLVIVVPFLSQLAYSELYVISLVIGLVAVIILALISMFMDSKKLARFYYPLTLVGIGVVGFVILYFVSPSTVNSMLGKFSVFTPDNNLLTVAEVRPLLFVGGKFTLSPLWNEFNTNVITALVALVILIIGFFKKLDPGKLLLLIWVILIFVATTSQVRFAAYLAVIMAMLSGFFYSEIINWIKRFFGWLSRGMSKSSAASITQTKHKVKKGAKLASDKNPNQSVDASKTKLTGSLMHKITAVSVCVLVVFLAGIYPSIKPAMATAGSNGGISPEWRESLLWMKANTPEPFQNADFYYQLYAKPATGTYAYPSSAYGVMAWWDYGHMITEIAHRIPNANPNQSGASSAGAYFVTQNEADSTKMLDALGSKYIILDYPIAVPFDISNNMVYGQKFYAMPTWAGKDPNAYSEILYQPKDNLLTPLPVYYPEYYYCMSTRLFNFHGAAAVPQNSTTVISFTVQSGRKVIQTTQTFATYEEATAFMKGHPSDNYRIVGTSPFVSPVPLEKLSHYKEVYKSPSGIVYSGQKTNSSYIEIFEYVP